MSHNYTIYKQIQKTNKHACSRKKCIHSLIKFMYYEHFYKSLLIENKKRSSLDMAVSGEQAGALPAATATAKSAAS